MDYDRKRTKFIRVEIPLRRFSELKSKFWSHAILEWLIGVFSITVSTVSAYRKVIFIDFDSSFSHISLIAAEGVGVPKMRHGALQWLLQMVQRGLYSLQLRHFFDYLDPSQILLVRSEDLYEDPVKVMKRIEKFLGLTSYDWEPFFEHKKVFNFGKANRVTSSESGIEYEPMKEEIRRELEKFFEPFNQDLYRMFKDTDPFPGWKYPKPVKKPKTEEADLASEDPPEYPADS